MNKQVIILKFPALNDLLEYLNIVPLSLEQVALNELIVTAELSDREIELAKNGFHAQIAIVNRE